MMLAGSKPITARRRKPKTAAEQHHFDRVAAMGCLVCGEPATIHHVTSDGFQRIARTHQRVAPLCPRHHMVQFGPRESVEALGHAGFFERYGVNLLEWADLAWLDSSGEMVAF